MVRDGELRRYTAYPRPVLWLVPEGDGVAPFYLSTLPVTNVQMEAFAPGFARSPLAAGDDDPALGVSLEAAKEYCRWYAGVSRKAIRLPREAEWEHACGGVGEEQVWHAGNSAETVPDLRARGSNSLGLYAMLGGVWEWVEEGVLRGGSWRTPLGEIVRGARRLPEAGEAPADAGFRIAKSLRG